MFLVYYLAKRAFGDGRAGLLAAGLLVTFPLAVLPFSWGITANVFGQFVGLAAIAIAVGCYERLTRPGPWLLLVGRAHAGAALAPRQRATYRAADRRSAGRLGAGRGAGLARDGRRATARAGRWHGRWAPRWSPALIAWFGYYQPLRRRAVADAAARSARSGPRRRPRRASRCKTGGEVNDLSLGLRQRIVRSRSTWLAQGLAGFAAEAWAYFHTWPLLWAGLGLYAARRGADPARRRMLRAAVVWAAVALLYAVVGWYANLYVRYPLFLLPLVALGAGLLLSALARRGRAGRLAGPADHARASCSTRWPSGTCASPSPTSSAARRAQACAASAARISGQ